MSEERICPECGRVLTKRKKGPLCFRCDVESRRSQQKKRYHANKEAIRKRRRQRDREIRETSPEKVEVIRERWRRWYQNNKETMHERQRQYREANHEVIKQRKYQARQENLEAYRERSRQKRKANPELYKEYYRRYRESHLDVLRERGRRYIRRKKVLSLSLALAALQQLVESHNEQRPGPADPDRRPGGNGQ